MRAIALGWLAAFLLLAACGGATWVGVGVGVGWGWYDYYDTYDPWGWCPCAVTAGDVDADGDVDVVVADGRDGKVYVLPGKGSAKLDAATAAPFIGRTKPRWIRVGRFNDDAVLDLVLVYEESWIVEVYFGDGAGGFVPATDAPRLTIDAGVIAACTGRLDADGFSDLVLVDGGGALHALLGDGRGGFHRAPQSLTLSLRAAGAAIACADFDEVRGRDVALVRGGDDGVAVLSGRGDGTFARGHAVAARIPGRVLDAAPCPSAAGDGSDLVLLLRDGERTVVVRLALQGERAGTLSEPLDVGRATRIAVVDITGDGLPDLLLVDPETGLLRVYRAARRA